MQRDGCREQLLARLHCKAQKTTSRLCRQRRKRHLATAACGSSLQLTTRKRTSWRWQPSLATGRLFFVLAVSASVDGISGLCNMAHPVLVAPPLSKTPSRCLKTLASSKATCPRSASPMTPRSRSTLRSTRASSRLAQAHSTFIPRRTMRARVSGEREPARRGVALSSPVHPLSLFPAFCSRLA